MQVNLNPDDDNAPGSPPELDPSPGRTWQHCKKCGAAFETGCDRKHCAPCLLIAAAQAQKEAKRILETPAISALRARIAGLAGQRVDGVPF